MNNSVLLVNDGLESLQSMHQLHKLFQIDIVQHPIEALNLLSRKCYYRAVVANLKMEIADGVQFLAAARKISPFTRLIAIANQVDSYTLIEAINKAQIFACLTMPVNPSVLIDTILSAISYFDDIYGKNMVSIDQEGQPCLRADDDLTLRENEVLNMVLLGFSNKEIAQRLGLTIGTVKSHCNNIYNKLGVHSRTQAIAKLLQRK
ncbi:MAG TPA: response regulator transcription factor [Methylomusa anaerophila]|uniref:Response regulator protein VraR n=1 Tax=Methylomusa anaerophila TaxID=1930071 RepID=A0A348AGD6_9FIRM|nr:response regulator transcription factor [Methylomusa anaerophila]BBB90134.1 response regulator protein VraR [Methylomusa anaerophila]HML88142.1 response regulator transcription factor [Methylomusa anaerophila]